VIVQGVKVEKEEVLSFREFLPGSAGAMLLGKVVLRLEKQGHDALRDRGSGIEALRYAQGWLDAMGRFEAIVQAMLAVDVETGETEEEAENEEEGQEAIDVDF